MSERLEAGRLTAKRTGDKVIIVQDNGTTALCIELDLTQGEDLCLIEFLYCLRRCRAVKAGQAPRGGDR